MNIKQFKKNDIVTRVEPSPISKDSSYMSDKLIFVGVEGKTIVLSHQRYGAVTLSEYEWGDGWEYYPQLLVDEADMLAGKIGISPTPEREK